MKLKQFLALFLIVFLQLLTEIVSQYEEDQRPLLATPPCHLAREAGHPKSVPFVRVSSIQDEVIVLGQGGLPYYSIPPTSTDIVVFECSSPIARVKWEYRGRGATSGLKILDTTWTPPRSSKLKASCFSASLVLTNVTDQLVGNYACTTVQESKENDSKKKKRRKKKREGSNGFVLYVPQRPSFYHRQGSRINLTVSSMIESLLLPCISKRRSSAGISLYYHNQGSSLLEAIPVGRNVTYNPFTGFQVIPSPYMFTQIEDKKVARFVCKFDRDLPQKYPTLGNKTLLEVDVVLKSPFSPVGDAPYFEWQSPDSRVSKVEVESSDDEGLTFAFLDQSLPTEVEAWDKHKGSLGSLELLNLKAGSRGKVRLIGTTTMIHEWNYTISDKREALSLEYSYDTVNQSHIVTCSGPKLQFTPLTTDEEEDDASFSTSDGFLSTSVPYGEVSCGERTLRIPPYSLVPSRPFFIERGRRIQVFTWVEEVITLPCLTNTNQAGPYISLLYRSNDSLEYETVWSGKDEELSEGIEFHPDWGFHVDTTVSKFTEGHFLCTSGDSSEDLCDAVNVTVKKTTVSISPEEEEIEDLTVLKWAWASEALELDVGEEGLRSLVERQEGPYWTSAVLTLSKGVLNSLPLWEGKVNVTLVDLRTKSVVHQWRIKKKEKIFGNLLGLVMNYSKDASKIEMTCRGSDASTQLSYYLCSNPATCDLLHEVCLDKDCSSSNMVATYEVDSECQDKGCVRRVLMDLTLNGYLQAVCAFNNGIVEVRNVSDFFFSEDSLNWDEPTVEVLLYVNSGPTESTDMNPDKEVSSIGSNLEWEVGETVQFSCAASQTSGSFAAGIKWGVEKSEESLVMLPDDYLYDPQWTTAIKEDLGILSTVNVVFHNFDIKRLWCFVPTTKGDKTSWVNASMPIFLRAGDEACAETEPSIHLINVHPPSSKVAHLDLTDSNRLDKLDYFVVPQNVMHLAVRVTASEPVEWTFSGHLTSTPLVQVDRASPDFYDPSSYCYTSKLLINLRHRNGNETGRFTARLPNHPENSPSFFLFVPSKDGPYLLNSGSTVNLTGQGETVVLPCLVNNPFVHVDLYKLKDDESFGKVEGATYDPRLGFTMKGASIRATFKCVVSPEDFLIVNVAPQMEEIYNSSSSLLRLKYDRVGQIHVFKCFSITEANEVRIETRNLPPSTQVQRKPCGSDSTNCAILMTDSLPNEIRCMDQDQNQETMTFSANSLKRSLRISHDEVKDVFKCVSNNSSEEEEKVHYLKAVTCRRRNECSLMNNKLISSPSKGSSLQIDSKGWFSVLLRCHIEDDEEGSVVFSQYFRDRGKTVPMTQDTVDSFKAEVNLEMVSYSQNPSSISIKLRCTAPRYFYSRGFKWGLLKKGTTDGSVMMQEGGGLEAEVQAFGASMSEIVIELGVEDVVDKYKAVICFVPLMEPVGEWANVTLDLSLLNKLSIVRQ